MSKKYILLGRHEIVDSLKKDSATANAYLGVWTCLMVL
jgi:hypothetical protein